MIRAFIFYLLPVLFFYFQIPNQENWTNNSIDTLVQVGNTIKGDTNSLDFGRRSALNENGTILLTSDRRNSKAYVFELKNNTWVQKGETLKGEGLQWFGFYLDISEDGNTIAVGSNNDGFKIFEWKDEEWKVKGQIFDYSVTNSETGRGVKLANNGKTIAFSSYYAENDKGIRQTGAAYIYDFKDGNWVQRGNTIFGHTEGQELGYSMDFSKKGDRIALSCPFNRSSSTKVFEFKKGKWIQVGNDVNPKDKSDGRALKFNASGNMLLSANDSRTVYVSRFEEGTWNTVTKISKGEDYGYATNFFQGRILIYNPAETKVGKGVVEFYRLSEEDELVFTGFMAGESYDETFGYNIEVSYDGSRLVIGSMPFENGIGSIRVYKSTTE